MKVLLVADAQSPHTQGWISQIRDHCEVHVASSFPIEASDLGVASAAFFPVDPTAKARATEKLSSYGSSSGTSGKPSRLRGTALWRALASARDRMAPALALKQAKNLNRHIQELQPDLVHAFRIPYEAIMAGAAVESLSVPLIVSTWGNDFSLYAEGSPTLAKLARRVMQRADGLHPDCLADLNRGRAYGFDAAKPFVVLPGNGGLELSEFSVDPDFGRSTRERLGIPPDALVVTNPRGLKPYIRNDLFFESIPLVLAKNPNAYFVAVGMEGKQYATNYVTQLGVSQNVILTKPLPRREMGALFAATDVVASLGEHDGTPNSVLESLACGSRVVALNIESLREWVTDPSIGELLSDRSAQSLADAILRTGGHDEENLRLREARAQHTRRWSREVAGPEMLRFYGEVLARKQG